MTVSTAPIQLQSLRAALHFRASAETLNRSLHFKPAIVVLNANRATVDPVSTNHYSSLSFYLMTCMDFCFGMSNDNELLQARRCDSAGSKES